MLSWFARRALKRMGAHYDYDVTYMLAMLDKSPKAFFRFAKLFPLAQHRESAPAEAAIAAKLMGAMYEDCGPCTQLVVNFAKEQGVDPEQVEAVLRRDLAGMNDNVALAFRFADAILNRLPGEDDVRDAVRMHWGEKGVIDLTLALQVGRIFPMVKAGLGYAKECRRVEVAGRPVDVVKRAA
jgi:alkylhydroperoxidase family enzyme